MTLEKRARELAWRIKGYPNRCAICSFQLTGSADKGCVIGNCSYRPHDGSAEDGRVSRNRAELAEIQGIIAAALAADGPEVTISKETFDSLCRFACANKDGEMLTHKEACLLSQIFNRYAKGVQDGERSRINDFLARVISYTNSAAAPSLHKESGESWPGIQCLNFASSEDAKRAEKLFNDMTDEIERLRPAALHKEGAGGAPAERELKLKQVLSEHWLTGIHCHHAISPDDSTYDWATCACSKVNLPHRGTVGEAVGTWIEHVLDELAAASPAGRAEQADAPKETKP